MELSAFMGHAPATVDDKGRLKIPAHFRKFVEEKYGPDCFITSRDGQNALIYPMEVWLQYQEKLARVPTSSAAGQKLKQRLSYFGQASSLDAQGRVLVPAVLRNVAAIASDVVVLGDHDHLVVWNEERIQKQMEAPLTGDDLKELELHGV